MYYVPFIYWGREGDKKKNVLCTFHIPRLRGWQEEECIMYLSFTEGERVTRTRMYYVSFIYWGWEGDKNNNVLCTFHILRVTGWQEQECIMYLSYTEGERVTRRRMYYVPFIYWGWEGERVTRTRMYYVPFIYRGWEGDKKKNVLCTFHILRLRGWQEEECIMYLSYTEGERVTRRRMYYVPFIYWDWEGDKKKNVLSPFHILRERGWQEEECIMYLSFHRVQEEECVCTFHILRLRGWQEEECIISLSYTEGERVTRRRMYYVPFIYWGWEGDKNKNVLCTFHILRVRGWQEQQCIMYLSYTEGERVTRRRMYYVPFIYWGRDGERVTRTRMYYVPFIYWGWEGDKKKNVLCTFHILRWEGYKKKNVLCAFHILRERGWEGDKNKNVLCTFHIPRLRGWQEEECIMYLSFTEGERVTRTRMCIYLSYTEIERVTRRRMYYLPFIYWGREGDKKKNVVCTFHILRLRGWQEEECIISLSYTEGERVTRRRMYYVPFIYWGWEGDKNKNVLCTFHILRLRGWQEEECIMYLSYTEGERVTRRRMYYVPFIYWGRDGERVTRTRMYYVPFIYRGWEGDKKKNVLCTFHLLRVRGWQEQECSIYLSYTEIERVTRRRMYYLPFIYWGREGDKKKNVVCTFHILRLRGWQEEECIISLSYTEGERVTRRRMYYVPFIYWGWEGDKNKNVLCTFHIRGWEGDQKKNVLCTFHILRLRGWQEEECIMSLSYTEGERVTRRRMYYVPFIYWGWEGDKNKNVVYTFHILRWRGWQEEECVMYLSYTEIERVTRRRMYYLPFIYWGWEGDKNKNVVYTFHILRLRGWQEEECNISLSYTEGERVTRRRMYYVPFIYWGREGDKKKNVVCTFHILRLRGWQEEECIISLSYTEGERVTRRRMYYVPFIYWGWEGDKNKNVLCIFHILRVRGWQEQQCIMYLSYTEGERVTRRRMYYVPFIYWGRDGERVTRRRMYYVPFIYWGREGDKKKNVLCTIRILSVRRLQEEECIKYLSYT